MPIKRISIPIQNQSSDVGTATIINFSGSAVSVSLNEGIATVLVSSSGSSSTSITQGSALATAAGFDNILWFSG